MRCLLAQPRCSSTLSVCLKRGRHFFFFHDIVFLFFSHVWYFFSCPLNIVPQQLYSPWPMCYPYPLCVSLNVFPSKRQRCIMGTQSAGSLRTFLLRGAAFFDACFGKHRQLSPDRGLLGDEAQHKNTNEHIRRKPQKENATVVNGIVSCVVGGDDAPSRDGDLQARFSRLLIQRDTMGL